MAARTPATVRENDPNMLPINAAGDTAPAVGGPAISTVRHRVFRFDDVSNGDTWTSGIRGIVHLATQKILASTYADALLTTAATGVITFSVDTGTPDFFLHVWSYD